MSLIDRVRRLWYLSGQYNDADDVKMAESIKKSKKKFHKKKKHLATIVKDAPEEFFPIAED